MNWTLHIREKVKKAILGFPLKDRENIRNTLLALNENPYYGDIVKLEGEDNLWRRRVGAYRIKFQIKNDEKIVYPSIYSFMVGYEYAPHLADLGLQVSRARH